VCTPVILALEVLRQEDSEFKARAIQTLSQKRKLKCTHTHTHTYTIYIIHYRKIKKCKIE
jgi:ADP-dependent phosphofructokinase/glucokinase